jgi:hypothetical protein
VLDIVVQIWCLLKAHVQLLLGFVGFAGVWAMFRWPIRWIWERWWPDREHPGKEWVASSSYGNASNPNVALSKNRRMHWRSTSPQHVGAWFEIDLNKGRVLRGIELDHGNSQECPLRWYLQIRDKNNKYLPVNDDSMRYEGEGKISVILQHPQRVRFIRIAIKDSMLAKDGNPYYWSIVKVYLKEVRIKRLLAGLI